MNIRICKDKIAWNKLLISLNQAEFLQSWEWGEFQQQVGNEPLRLLVEGVPIQGFVHCLPAGFSMVYIPRSVLLTEDQETALYAFLKAAGHIFVRIEPSVGRLTSGVLIANRQPSVTLQLDLCQTEEQLLANMHSKTRYNIRLAAKNGVLVTKQKDIEIFWTLNTDTTKRDKFKSHGKEYYKNMLASPFVEQFIAWYEGEPIATILCISYQKTFVYMHGASANNKRNVMAPYLLQWHAMQYAKQLGNTIYDFWGIASQNKEGNGPVTTFNGFTWKVDHPWTGVTRFKVGFGGMVVEYPMAHEIPLRKVVYAGIQLAKKFL